MKKLPKKRIIETIIWIFIASTALGVATNSFLLPLITVCATLNAMITINQLVREMGGNE